MFEFGFAVRTMFQRFVYFVFIRFIMIISFVYRIDAYDCSSLRSGHQAVFAAGIVDDQLILVTHGWVFREPRSSWSAASRTITIRSWPEKIKDVWPELPSNYSTADDAAFVRDHGESWLVFTAWYDFFIGEKRQTFLNLESGEVNNVRFRRQWFQFEYRPAQKLEMFPTIALRDDRRFHIVSSVEYDQLYALVDERSLRYNYLMCLYKLYNRTMEPNSNFYLQNQLRDGCVLGIRTHDRHLAAFEYKDTVVVITTAMAYIFNEHNVYDFQAKPLDEFFICKSRTDLILKIIFILLAVAAAFVFFYSLFVHALLRQVAAMAEKIDAAKQDNAQPSRENNRNRSLFYRFWDAPRSGGGGGGFGASVSPTGGSPKSGTLSAPYGLPPKSATPKINSLQKPISSGKSSPHHRQESPPAKIPNVSSGRGFKQCFGENFQHFNQ